MAFIQHSFFPTDFSLTMKTISNDIFFSQVESEIAAGKSIRFRVKGHSMFPLLRNNKDEVTLSPLNRQPEINDIVLFRYHGKHILHRIIAIDGNTYTIQGDGIYLSCEKCTSQDIIGIVTQIHKNGKMAIGATSKRSLFYNFCWQRLRFCRRFLLVLLRRIYK